MSNADLSSAAQSARGEGGGPQTVHERGHLRKLTVLPDVPAVLAAVGIWELHLALIDRVQGIDDLDALVSAVPAALKDLTADVDVAHYEVIAGPGRAWLCASGSGYRPEPILDDGWHPAFDAGTPEYAQIYDAYHAGNVAEAHRWALIAAHNAYLRGELPAGTGIGGKIEHAIISADGVEVVELGAL